MTKDLSSEIALEIQTHMLTSPPKTKKETTTPQTGTSSTTETTMSTVSTATTTTANIATDTKTEPYSTKTTPSTASKKLQTSPAPSATTSTTVSTTTTTGTTSTTETKTTVLKPEPEKSTATTITTTSASTSTTSTEMPYIEHEKKPQGDQPKCNPLTRADIIFGLQAIGGVDRKNVAEFIKAVGDGLDLKSGSFKLGLKENCKENVLYPTEFVYFDDYKYAVSDVMETDIAPILFHTRRAFNLSKRRAARVVILLVSGKVNDMHRVYRLAEKMKRNTKIIVVGVGKLFETEQLQGLASYRDRAVPDISHVFPVTDSENLLHIVKKVIKLLCD